jgi:hypothetical protein
LPLVRWCFIRQHAVTELEPAFAARSIVRRNEAARLESAVFYSNSQGVLWL